MEERGIGKGQLSRMGRKETEKNLLKNPKGNRVGK